jgi:hypothetical protein
MHDMGLVEYFEPTRLTALNARPRRIFSSACCTATPAGSLRVPRRDACRGACLPGLDGALEAHVRDHGAHTIPAVAQAWLTFVMPEHHARRLGVSVGCRCR